MFLKEGGSMFKFNHQLIGLFILVSIWHTYPYFDKTYSINDLKNKSDLICYGVVDSIYYTEDINSKLPFTFIDIKITKILKGQNMKTVLVRELGGFSNKVGNVFPSGSPIYKIGEEVFVFLRKNKIHDFYYTCANKQGKYIIKNENGIKKVYNKIPINGNEVINNSKSLDAMIDSIKAIMN